MSKGDHLITKLFNLLVAIALLLSVALRAAAAYEARTPESVSPGHPSHVSAIESRCPTFSWTEVSSTRHYDLVIYEVGDGLGDLTEAGKTRVGGGATTWTPSLDGCLERGGRYAWSIRAVLAKGESSEWSTPSLFAVAPGPSDRELEQALEIVRRHDSPLESASPEAGYIAETSAPSELQSTSRATPLSAAPPGTQMSVDGNLDAASFSGDGSLLTSLTPSNLSAGTAPIDVSGTASNVTGTVAIANGGTGAGDAAGARANLGVAAGPHVTDTDTTCLDAGVDCHFAASDSESGAALSGDSATAFFSSGQIEEPRIADEIARDSEILGVIAAIDRYCPGALGSGKRYSDCGNGAIRDNNTGLYWLKDASCADLEDTDANGAAEWATAEDAAAALADGTCGLTDGSVPGDWRQPTISEFCSAWAGSLLSPCPAAAAATSLVDSSVGPPNVVNSAGTGVWTSGDPFDGVQSSNYWSSTTDPSDPSIAWEALLNIAQIGQLDRTDALFVWPVRDQP